MAQPRGTTAVEIARMLESRIHSGEYAAGTQLPTVRELAQELGVNKNTVVRAYQALEHEGYLEVTQGRGAFVRQRDVVTDGVNGRWQAQADRLVQEARRRGLDKAGALRELRESVNRVYGAGDLRIAFVECNTPDIEEMGGQLRTAVGHGMEGVFLHDILDQPVKVAARYDLIVTTFIHLSEVSRALDSQAVEKVVGVHAMPTHDDLLRIARLHAMVIGLVCEFPNTMDSLTHIIKTYHPSATVLSALIDDEARLRSLLSKSDALIVTRSCADRVAALQPAAPVITVSFSIDQQSVDFLRSRIEKEMIND